eukprot:CAMPEP_0174364178 /NCGR_PEP_ID=MMETSP0811_2-20130205/71828_1 /TAXON_ID=73025 ORGANISM="Eutreptiella gymnastica-like, Strain CCMP1594" /NCGR_SAMPLE_ID=MMETSP0811_2 /ASSEMBLY_ACC=CAM_ASM_000667 /LENGTH=81 /DNA_ID=CAMNT_0015503563 /DNA_START=262 /DNA_END=507 /DNA_ORIENTATION=+
MSSSAAQKRTFYGALRQGVDALSSGEGQTALVLTLLKEVCFHRCGTSGGGCRTKVQACGATFNACDTTCRQTGMWDGNRGS